MIIPYERLSSETLRAVVEEYINREGTDYGQQELSLNDKVELGLAQLRNREAVIVFDPTLESTTIMPRLEAEQWERDQ